MLSIRKKEKSITLKENEFNIISEYAKRVGLSFSEFLRKSSLSVIEQNEELELREFMNKHLDKISKSEQEEIDGLGIDFSEKNGKAIDINDFL